MTKTKVEYVVAYRYPVSMMVSSRTIMTYRCMAVDAGEAIRQCLTDFPCAIIESAMVASALRYYPTELERLSID